MAWSSFPRALRWALTSNAVGVERMQQCSCLDTGNAIGVMLLFNANSVACYSPGQRPGLPAHHYFEPQRGDIGVRRFNNAPLGLGFMHRAFPRALPWALTCNAVGVENATSFVPDACNTVGVEHLLFNAVGVENTTSIVPDACNVIRIEFRYLPSSNFFTTINSFPRSSITLTAICRCSPASNGALTVPARWSHTLSE